MERCAEPGAARHPPQPQDRRSVARPAPLGPRPIQSHWCNHLGLPRPLARRIARLVVIRRLAPSRGSPEDVMANSFAKRRYARGRGCVGRAGGRCSRRCPPQRALRGPLSDRHRGPTRAVSKCTSPRDRSRRASILLCLGFRLTGKPS